MKGKWHAAPPEMVARFNVIVRDLLPGAEMRRMFGYPCVFVNGNMLAGLFDDFMMMRLSPTDRQAFLQLDGAREFSPMPGRPMREYVAVPSDILADDERLAAWLERGRAYAESLPAKPKVGK
jgi:TfoX/Sxy family transcriptional regulator of competence genes